MRPVKFVTRLPGLSRFPPQWQPWEADLRTRDVQRAATTAEALGYDALTVGDHVIMATADADAMGGWWPHALTVLSFLAGSTTRINLVTSVLALPLHDPIELAKEIATLDVLSEGRLSVGFGTGFLERQYQILGVPFGERGPRADEHLLAMKELWTSSRPSFHGEHVSFDDVVFEPKPWQQPHPPIWIGGDSPAAIRRAARHADGWRTMGTTLEELPARLELLRSQPGFDGRGRPFGISMPLPLGLESTSEVVDLVGRMAAAGVTSVTMPTPRALSFEHYLDELAAFATDVIGAP
jgi:probable F420-dependent oxidoreductase